MSDALETVATGGVGAIVASPFAVWLAKRFVRKADALEAQEKADMRAAIAELKAENAALREMIAGIKEMLPLLATKERVDGALAAQGKLIHGIDRWLTKVDTRVRDRLGIADSDEVHTNPGHKLSPEMQASVAQYAQTAEEETPK